MAMALKQRERRQFVDAYSNMLLTSWGDESYAQRLARDPKAAAMEAGLQLPAGANVTIVRHPADQVGSDEAAAADLEAQVGLYAEGLRTGEFVFHVPETPVLDVGELSLDELGAVAAGTTYCCCCCPACSSCTV